MIWKKNWFSVILWAACLLGSSAALIFCGYQMAPVFGITDEVLALAVGCGLWAFILMLFCILRVVGCAACKARDNIKKSVYDNNKDDEQEEGDAGIKISVSLIYEGVILTCLLALGLSLRVLCMSRIISTNTYFEAAKVTHEGVLPQVAHGATYFYLQLLRMTFTIAGNHLMAGIWLQSILQMTGTILLYFGIRKLANAGAALLVVAYMMVMPSEVIKGITYSPNMLFQCVFGAAMLGIAMFFKRIYKEKQKPAIVVLHVITSMMIGLSCYLDISGLMLIALCVTGIWLQVKKKEKVWNRPWRYCILLILMSALAFAGCIAIDAFSSRSEWLAVLKAWCELYMPNAFVPFWGFESVNYLFVIAVALLVLVMFVYWFRRDGERFLPWLIMMLCLCLMKCFGLFSQFMDSFDWFYWLAWIVGTIGVTECFVVTESAGHKEVTRQKRNRVRTKSADGVNDNMHDAVPQSVSNEVQDEEVKADFKEDPQKELQKEPMHESKTVNYIPNPLPVPKRHVKKNMEFSFEPSQEEMKFDIEVSENDDFDL